MWLDNERPCHSCAFSKSACHREPRDASIVAAGERRRRKHLEARRQTSSPTRPQARQDGTADGGDRRRWCIDQSQGQPPPLQPSLRLPPRYTWVRDQHVAMLAICDTESVLVRIAKRPRLAAPRLVPPGAALRAAKVPGRQRWVVERTHAWLGRDPSGVDRLGLSCLT